MKTTVLLAALALLPLPLPAADTPTFAEKADAPWRPLSAPRVSDVVMRSLRPRPASPADPHDTLATAREFHATRLEWTYLGAEDVGGGSARARAFIAEAHRLGLLVGGAGSGSSQQVEPRLPQPLSDFCVLDLDQRPYVMPHKRGWAKPPGQGSVFSPEYFAAHLERLAEQVRLGCDTLQRDEAQMAAGVGFDFHPLAIAAFRRHLAQHSTAAERDTWGLGAVELFDVRQYFLSLQPPESRPDGWFARWERTNPVKRLYDRFIEESVAVFHQRTREALNQVAGRMVPFSCNNTSQQRWLAPHRAFDWGMSELMLKTAHPVHLYERVRAGHALGKVQVFSTPKAAGQPIAPDDFRALNRRVIAQAYAAGALGKVPWDLFLQSEDGGDRYFGAPADYADLYGFVRALAPWLEGFEEAAVCGPGLDDRARWAEAPLRVEGGASLFGFVRVRPRDPASPVVLHLVNWGDPASKARVALRKSALPRGGAATARLLVPAPYNRPDHVWAEFEQNRRLQAGEKRGPQHAAAYQSLVRETALAVAERAGWVEVTGVSAAPWSVIVIE